MGLGWQHDFVHRGRGLLAVHEYIAAIDSLLSINRSTIVSKLVIVCIYIYISIELEVYAT